MRSLPLDSIRSLGTTLSARFHAGAWALALTALLAFGLVPAHAEMAPILLDGVYGDWTPLSPVWIDPTGDGGGSGIDFADLWAADDERFFFLRFTTGAEVNLDESNSLYLYLDTDANAATGLPMGGIGAELLWRFGARDGSFYRPGQVVPIEHDDIGFVALPTVSATEFELAIAKDALPDGSHPLFQGPVVRILLRNFVTGGDWAPDQGQILEYTLGDGSVPADEPLPVTREVASDLRLLTWNVLQDGPWDGSLEPKFGRLVGAADPQILAFQEIYSHTISQTRTLVESWLPSGQGQAWYGAEGYDCHVVSRYPILGSWDLDGNVAVYINGTAGIGSRLLLINAHLPCCSNDPGRQAEVDRILAFIRDAREPGGTLTLPQGAPIVVVGDMNFVGDDQQLLSLLTGDIVDNATWGPDFAPDWDATGLEDVISQQTELRMAYTWRNDSGAYWPGRLDFVIYTDSVVDLGNHFILYTPEMSPDQLAALGLEAGDSNASDHLPHVADFRPEGATVAEEPVGGGSGAAALGGQQWAPAPNPSRGALGLRLSLGRPEAVTLELFDPAGRLVSRPLNGRALAAGDHLLTGLSGGNLPPGVYFLRLSTASDGADATALPWIVVR